MAKADKQLQSARTSNKNLRSKLSDKGKEYKAKLRAHREDAADNAKSQRIMTAVEVPLAGAAAGGLDAIAKPIKGVVPWSAVGGFGGMVAGLFWDQGDLLNIGAGMLAGAGYAFTNSIVTALREGAEDLLDLGE